MLILTFTNNLTQVNKENHLAKIVLLLTSKFSDLLII